VVGKLEDAQALVELLAGLGQGEASIGRLKTGGRRSQQTPTKVGIARPKHETRLGQILISTMQSRAERSWHKDDLGGVLEAKGYCARSVSPLMSFLSTEGVVRGDGRGHFWLTAAGASLEVQHL
jgi:hypothetical protein